MKKIGDNYNISPFQFNRPLDAACDNVIAWRLGEIATKAASAKAGDPIDTGCALLNLLNQHGFEIRAIRNT